MESTRTWVGSTRTRTKIIEATARMVLEHGMRKMTVQQILDEAEISRRTFYQHFRSKEEAASSLYRSVTREMVREIHSAMKKVDNNLEDRLEAGLGAYLRFQRQVGDLVTLLCAEAADPDSPLAPQHEESLNALMRLMANEVEKGRDFAIDDHIYRALMLGLEGLCVYRRDHGELKAPDFKRIAVTIRALFDALLASASKLPRAEE